MSTSYEPYCLDCEETHPVDDCRWPEAIAILCRNAEKIAALAPMFAALSEAMADPNLHLRYDRERIDPAWFVKHAGHRLVVRDEYGRCIDECGDYFSYCECGHKQRCRRPRGHADKHAPTRDPDSTSARPEGSKP